jgi:hypothetical protein
MQEVITAKSVKTVTVRGTAYFDFEAAAEITVKKISGQLKYDHGKIVKSRATGYGHKWAPRRSGARRNFSNPRPHFI